MTDFNDSSCRFCLKTITNKNFEVIDDVIKDSLDFLLLRLKCDGNSGEIICKECRMKLNAASEFKTLCLDTNKTIIPYVDCEKILEVNLGEINKNGNGHLTGTSNSHEICRLCMQLITDEVRCICKEELHAIETFLPEMNTNMIKDTVICKSCFDALCTHSAFLKFTKSETDTFPCGSFIKIENLEKQSQVIEMEMAVKAECVDIKSEEEEHGDTPLCSLINETFENSDCKDAEEEEEKPTSRSANKSDKPSEARMFKCDFCDYETKHRAWIKRHSYKHKDISEVPIYKCSLCEYGTKYKGDLTRHHKKHQTASEAGTYKCKDCDYKTKYKNYLAHHSLKHVDPSQAQIYKCDMCPYESRFKKNLIRHQVAHKDPSEVPMYKCADCDYESKHRNGIRHHVLKHKDSSQVQVFKCEDCGYESKHKPTFADHLLTHKDPSEVQMYECDACDFQTKRKRSLGNHKLTHKGLSEVRMYSCNTCSFKTKYRNSIRCHELTHKKKLVAFNDV